MIKALLLLLSAAKLGKILTVVGTMLLSVAVYTHFFGMQYAVGLVGLIFVHEMGHVIAAKQKRLNVGVPAFIPFVGAWIQLKEQPMSVETEAYVAMAGPVIGTLGALGCYFVGRQIGDDFYVALSYTGFLLNLFNLIPLSPLDGGRITAALSPRMWLLGGPILVAVFFMTQSVLLLAIAILAFPNFMKAFKYNPALPENAAYYGTSLETKITYAVFYLGLAAFLAIMCTQLHDELAHIR